MYFIEINSLILHGIEVLALSVFSTYSVVNGLRSEREGEVHWSLTTYPIIAGEDVKLTCVVSDKNIPCNKGSNRMWEGGPEGKLLLLNGVPSNHEKYREESYNICTNFSLVIRKFTEHDVNCKYRCSLGFEESRRTELTIDDTSFISKPSKNSYHRLTVNESAVDIVIQFYNVYPFPKCMMSSAWVPNVDFRISNQSRDGMYYDIRLHATQMFPETCRYHWQQFDVSVQCSLLGLTVSEFSENLNCSKKHLREDNQNGIKHMMTEDSFPSQKYTLIYVIAPIIVFVPFLSYLICCIVTKRRTDSNNRRNNKMPLTNALLPTAKPVFHSQTVKEL